MLKKNFSLLLALRYLNPIRTHVSVITMISLLGVAAGVMVLVVTLSVTNGFERLLKDIVLTSKPHINLEHVSKYNPNAPKVGELEWRAFKKELEAEPYVKSVSPLVQDFLLVEYLGQKSDPKVMLGVDTKNPDELTKFKKVIQEGSADDLQNGDTVVISSRLSDNLGIPLGAQILLHSSSNLRKIEPIYKLIDTDLLAVREAEFLKQLQADISKEGVWKSDGLMETTSLSHVKLIAYSFCENHLDTEKSLRQNERDILNNILDELTTYNSRDVQNDSVEYNDGTKDKVLSLLLELSKIDKTTSDNKELRNLREVMLPKELTVVGITQTNNFAKGTDVFVPFTIAQDLADTEGGIQGLAVTLNEPYQAGIFKDQLLAKHQFNIEDPYSTDPQKLAPQWYAQTWMESSAELFKIMEMQKFMMVFVLSFIVLIAVFSIAAVMFTVAIQKKREIGVMKALGATPRQIVNVFTYQGIFVGAVGSVAGLLVGYIVVINVGNIQAFIRNTIGYNPFPKSIYGTDTMPTHIIPLEFAVVGVGALVLCTIASLVPAWSASRADAARSLRNL